VIRNRVRAGIIFFLTLGPKNLSLYEIYSAPTLVFSKFRGVVPWKESGTPPGPQKYVVLSVFFSPHPLII